MDNVTLIVAFTAGVLSFLSPCIFPLIPAYVAHLTGSLVKDNRVDVEKKLLIARSLSFILGFSIIFVVLGASASLIGQLFAEYRGAVMKISGLLIVIFGLQMARVLNFRLLMKEVKWQVKPGGNKGFVSSLLLGLAFGTGWTPCVGIALSSILLLAGSSDTMLSGMVMLFMYAIGLGVPFLIISLLITTSLNAVKRMNRFVPTLSLVNGWILTVMGILLFTGQLQKISSYLAQFTTFSF
ncbi:MAG: cytochrome biosis protein DsbD [Paenibacillaceae bacterium]|jgi:cytochrome c-type biogenesis protein|nr:cytochrome biosis protein DsbD [Paenibacillaceae bacterium]